VCRALFWASPECAGVAPHDFALSCSCSSARKNAERCCRDKQRKRMSRSILRPRNVPERRREIEKRPGMWWYGPLYGARRHRMTKDEAVQTEGKRGG